MQPNNSNVVGHYNINFRYFRIASIEVKNSDNETSEIKFDEDIPSYIKKHYEHDLYKFEYKYKTEVFELESSIPFPEVRDMIADCDDPFKKNFIKKLYENTIDEISAKPVKDVSIGRLLRLYNEPARENAVYSTSRCGFSVIIKMTDESYLNRLLNIFNKVDYGFIKSKIMQEEYTEIEVFIYSSSKIRREHDIQKIIRFIKGYLKCYEDSFEIKRFDVITKDLSILHKFNITGQDDSVFELHGDKVGITYFMFNEESGVNRGSERGIINTSPNRLIVTLNVTIATGIDNDNENNSYYTELNNINMLEDASFIPEKFSYVKKLLSDKNAFKYRESIAYDGKIENEFILGENSIDSQDIPKYLNWFKTPLECLFSKLCYIDHVFRNMVFYGPYLDNRDHYLKCECVLPIKYSDEESEQVHVFFNVKLTPYVVKRIDVDPLKQIEFDKAIDKIMNIKYNPIAPNIGISQGINGGKINAI